MILVLLAGSFLAFSLLRAKYCYSDADVYCNSYRDENSAPDSHSFSHNHPSPTRSLPIAPTYTPWPTNTRIP